MNLTLMLDLQTNFFKAPNDIFEHYLNRYELLVYLYLCRCANNCKYAYPSENMIMEKCFIRKKKNVTDAIKSLEQKGLIKVIRNRRSFFKSSVNNYEVFSPTKFEPEMEDKI
jgi:DNA-binding MarR family transcriptional regulator